MTEMILAFEAFIVVGAAIFSHFLTPRVVGLEGKQQLHLHTASNQFNIGVFCMNLQLRSGFRVYVHVSVFSRNGQHG